MKLKKFEFNNFPVNTYLLHDETGEAVLIDCGCMYPEEEAELNRYIKENNLSLKRLLCTHLHLDHVMGNAYVYQKYGLSPEAHIADVKGLPTLEQQALPFGIQLPRPSVPITTFLKEGEVIRFGNSTLSVIHVPGHSPGSVVFYNAKNKVAISGDVLFYNSIGRTDLWGGNQDELIEGIKDKLFTLPDETVIYPGHGPETTIENEKTYNPFL